MSKKAIIIGAGPAGLTAAYTLLKETDYVPIILEETAFIGGISRTAVYQNNRIDIGGHRFFSKSDAVMSLWAELMPVQGAPAKDDILLGREKPLSNGGPDPEKDEAVMLVRDRVSRIFYLRKFFDYPISLKMQTFANMGLWRTIQAGVGYLFAAVFKRKEESLEDFYINRFGKPLYRMFFEDYTEKLWGVHPSDISPEWGAQRVKGLSLLKALFSALTKPFQKDQTKVETSLIEQYLYPKKGPGQFWEIMAEKVVEMGGEIRMNARVTDIRTTDHRVTSVTVSENDSERELSADIFFSSMPVKDLVQAIGETAPKNVQDIAADLPYRDFITVGLLLNKMCIQNTTRLKTVSNIVPDCWIYIQERDVKIGRLQIFNNWSPYMVNDLENTVWIGLEYFCSEGDTLWNMPSEAFISFAIDELIKIDIIRREDVLDATHIRVKKAYPAYFGSYARFDEVRAYLDKFSNLYCIGRNGQHRYNNMDHSMLTAMEAVHLLQTGQTEKATLWNVNTEEEYHEQKSAK